MYRSLLCLLLLAGSAGCDETVVGQRSRPALLVSTDRIDFELLPVGSTDERSFSVANAGDDPLTVSGMTLTGDARSVFVVEPTTLQLRGGETAPVQVRYAPEEVASDQATLSFQSNAASGADAVVELRGRAVAVMRPDGGQGSRDAETALDAAEAFDGGLHLDAAAADVTTEDAGFVDATARPDAVAPPQDPTCPTPVVVPTEIPPPPPPPTECPGTQTWTVAGRYALTVPAGCTRLMIEVWGAGGGGGGGVVYTIGDPRGAEGAGGAYVRRDVDVAAGALLDIAVGQGGAGSGCQSPAPGGWPGGGRGGVGSQNDGGGGGGLTAVAGPSGPLAVAGGGGGGAGHGWGSSGRPGAGGPGGPNGAPGIGGSGCEASSTGGRGGTAVVGGAGGTGVYPGAPGAALQGGAGADAHFDPGDPGAGGGGGAGVFGGGGGGAAWECNASGSGGGGGASLGDDVTPGRGREPGRSASAEAAGWGGLGADGQRPNHAEAGKDGRVVIRWQ